MIDFSKYVNKELFVRKKMTNFIEKLFKFLGYSFDHDRYKNILYSEDNVRNQMEEKVKNSYDAYIYLLSNCKNTVTQKFLNTFFYIYFGKEIDSNVTLRIATKYFGFIDYPPFETAVDFHIQVYNEIDCANEEDKLIISLMFFNYLLVKNNIPTIRLLPNDLDIYLEKKKEYLNGNQVKLYEFFLNILEKEKVQDKSYYQNLKEITLKDIYNFLLDKKDWLKTELQIKHLSVFGSFAKGMNRLDSDIDLLVCFSGDLTSEEKNKKVGELKQLCTMAFNRFTDLSEVSDYLNDDFIKNLPYVKKIF